MYVYYFSELSIFLIGRRSFTGKERDSETGYYDHGARYYDPMTVTGWTTVDPMLDKYPGISPYAYCAWNPVKLVDPDGREINPIYDENGSFLGTDNNGLKGKAIVMKKKNFKQGMPHAEALRNNLGTSGLKSETSRMRLLKHYGGLKNRPDYDGIVNLREANRWYRDGNGSPLYVDASKIRLSPISIDDFLDANTKQVNYESFKNLNIKTGLVYGTLTITLLNNESGCVMIGDESGRIDNYGFEMHHGRTLRNIATLFGKLVAGKGKPYDINGYNYGKIK